MRQLPLCPRGFVETSVWVGVGGGGGYSDQGP